MNMKRLLAIDTFFALGAAALIMNVDSEILFSNQRADELVGPAEGKNLVDLLSKTAKTPHTQKMSFIGKGRIADRIAKMRFVDRKRLVTVLVYNQYAIELHGEVLLACNFREATKYEIDCATRKK